MIRIFLLFAIIAVGDVQPAFTQDGSPPAGSYLWSKSFGGAGNAIGYAVAADSSGNVVVTGCISGTVDFGGGALTSAGDCDIFVAKFTSGGSHLWSKRFGSTGYDVGYGIAVDSSGDVVVTGTFEGTVDFGGGPLTSAGLTDIFVAKLSGANGSHLWSKRFGGSDEDSGRGAAVDSSGNVLLTGDIRNATVDFGGGPLTTVGGSDIFVAKFSGTDGSHIWSKRFGSDTNDIGWAVAVDNSGNAVVTGRFSNTVDFGGGPLTSAGNYDIFVVKLSGAGGTHLWSKRFGGAPNDFGNAVAVASGGNVVLTGLFGDTVDFGGGVLTSVGGSDIFVVELSGTDGGHLWSKRFGGVGTDTGNAIAVDGSGDLAVTGSFSGSVNFGGGTLTSAGGSDIFLAELSGKDGAHLWSKSFGGVTDDTGYGLAVDSSGDLVMTGSYSGTVDFGGGPLSSFGTADVFVAKFVGQVPVLSLIPSNLDFGNQPAGSTSGAKTVTVTNTGSQAVTLASIGVNAEADFAQANNCPLTPATLGSGNSCTIDVTFSPATAGSLLGEITIITNPPGIPGKISLAGTGTSALVSLSHTALDFGNQLPSYLSRPFTVTLTNSGNLSLQLFSMTISGEFSMSSTCGSTLEAGANCSVSIQFLPSSMGTRSGQLTIWSNAPGSPHTVALSGTGADLVMSLLRPNRPIRQNGSSSANVAQIRLASNGKADIAVSCTGAPAGTNCQVQPTVVRSGARSQTVSVWLTVEPENWSELSPSVTPGMNYPILVTASIGDDAQEVSVPVPLQVLPPERVHARYSRLKYKHQAPARSIDGNSNRP